MKPIFFRKKWEELNNIVTLENDIFDRKKNWKATKKNELQIFETVKKIFCKVKNRRFHIFSEQCKMFTKWQKSTQNFQALHAGILKNNSIPCGDKKKPKVF